MGDLIDTGGQDLEEKERNSGGLEFRWYQQRRKPKKLQGLSVPKHMASFVWGNSTKKVAPSTLLFEEEKKGSNKITM